MLIVHNTRRRLSPLTLPFFINMICCNASSDASKAKECSLPSTLTSKPIKSIVPPGECQFGDNFTAVPLLENIPVSSSSFVARFGLPDKSKGLGLSTCACILAGVKIGDEEDMVIRPYTPISTNEDKGYFDLLIKKYPDGKMSSFLSELKPSTTPLVSFKHIPFNVKIQYPFNSSKHILMIAGGTGITPIIQALHAILGENPSLRSTQKVTLLYGSRTTDDILGEEMLTHWAQTHSNIFNVIHVLSHEDSENLRNNAKRDDIMAGFINRDLIEEYFPFGTDDDVLVMVCGPPPMYKALCGAREDKDLSGVLAEMGYKAEQVFKF